MSEYTIDQAVFSLPSGWFDRSLNVLGPEPSVDEFKVLVSRADQNGRALDDFVSSQVKDLSQRMPWFEEKGRDECMVAGMRALSVRSTFRDGKSEMFQQQVTLVVRGKFVTFTAASLARVEEACSKELARLLATVRVRPILDEGR
ncbi:DcrB-related protein [Polyangium mundeleinium]|uniref:DcrB-related protein n=1 Tax=Polyangium mundeleinium TaxID=2995306 RepID=A0ABT5F452_9BACT|nr:DcrB-related protein [Polyangium mundeleinium]MDC0748879.1 DcrB-related protein [Polyangium mundeleinium]